MSCISYTPKTVVATLALLMSVSAQASVTPDRTRLVFNESAKSISVTLRNSDSKLPYLAQSWIEDDKGNKINSPLAVLPPVQRIDALMNGQVRVQAMPDTHLLPADRETMFYYNVREIPPKANKPGTLQIALQSRIKLFWRPKAIENADLKHPWQHKVTLTRAGGDYTVNNPTAYYVIISKASADKEGMPPEGFLPLVIPPKTSQKINVKLNMVPVLTYVNDYGARMPLFFRCSGDTCQVDVEQSNKG